MSLTAIQFKPWTQEFKHRTRVGLVIQIITLLVGMLLGVIHSYYPQNHLSKAKPCEGKVLIRVESTPISKAKSTRFEASALAQLKDTKLTNLAGGLIVYGPPECFAELAFGDKIWINTRLQPISGPINPHEFDYRSFMTNRGISHQVYINDQKQYAFASASTDWTAVFTSSRDFLQAELNKLPLEKDRISVISALLLGQKQTLDPDLGKSFAAAGAMHVLAVSGLHVGLIFLILSKILFFFERVKNGPWVKAAILILLLWLYAGITGFSPSVLRATTMFTAIAIAQASTRRTNIYNTLAFSAIALVIVNPRIIYEVGFQLSYLAVVGIVFLQPRIYGWINSKNWLIDKAWQISSVSIAAQIATFPLSLYYFHMFPSYFLISNLIVIPLTGVVLSLGLIYFTVCWIPLFQNLIGHILSWSVDLLSTLVSWVGNLAGSQIEIGDLKVLQMLLLYGAIMTFIGYCVRYHLTWLKIAISCVIGMVSIAALTDEIRSEQRLITIYEVRGKEVIGIKRGHECWLMTETGLDSKDLSYMIEPDLMASGISEIHQITFDKHFQIVRKDMLLSQEAIKLGKLELKGPNSLIHLARIVAETNLSSWH